ncbi:hypothetical protein Pelo_19843 [Pelomyxa schiedti]|nr:hypothetical protein Pelo_19843 [Pelomyxa schiedti]
MDDGIETALSSAQTENINVNYCNDSLAVKPAFAEPKNLTPTEEMSLKGVTGGKVWMDDNRPERAEGGKRNTLEGDSEGFREEVFIEGEQGVNDGEGESRATVSAYDRELLQANERMKLCECAKKKSSSKRSDSQEEEENKRTTC